MNKAEQIKGEPWSEKEGNKPVAAKTSKKQNEQTKFSTSETLEFFGCPLEAKRE